MLNGNERDQSEFNMAVSWLNRLNSYFYMCNEAKRNYDLYNWQESLTILFCELSTEMKESEIIDKKIELKQLKNEVDKTIPRFTKTGAASIPIDLYWRLIEFELFIRDVLKSSGLQQRIKDDAMKALR